MPEQRCCRWCGWAGRSPVAPPCWPSWASPASSAWTRSRLLSSLHSFNMSTCRHASSPPSSPPPQIQFSLKNPVLLPRLRGCAQRAVQHSKGCGFERRQRLWIILTSGLFYWLIFTIFLCIFFIQCSQNGTPTKRRVSKRQVSKRPVSKRLKRQVYKTSGLQNATFTKCQVYKMSGLQNVRSKKIIHIYSLLVVGGNPQVLLQPCLQAMWWLCFILFFRGFLAINHHNGYDTLFTLNRNANLAIPSLFVY